MGRGLAWIGVLVFVASWFVPVMKDQDALHRRADAATARGERAARPLEKFVGDETRKRLSSGPERLPGWQAARYAWEVLVGNETRMTKDGETWKNRVYGTTCLTNVLMFAAILFLLPGRSGSLLLGLGLLGAALLNSSWYFLSDPVFASGLRPGYYLWAGSFLLVGLGLLGGRDPGLPHPSFAGGSPSEYWRLSHGEGSADATRRGTAGR